MARYKYKTPDNDNSTAATGSTASPPDPRKEYLKGAEALALDYNQTRNNLEVQRNARKITNAPVMPAQVTKGQSMEATQLNNLRAATKGLVHYGTDTFPWNEGVTAMVTKLKGRHLEEIRQVVDDALNHARCTGGCTSACGRGCGSGCFAICQTRCGNDCKGGCGLDCAGGCGTGCLGGCTGTCGFGCTDGCHSGCRDACNKQCRGCSGTCDGGGYAHCIAIAQCIWNTCTSGCGTGCQGCRGCDGGCGSGCQGDCGTGCTGGCGTGCAGGCRSSCSATCGNADCTVSCASNCTHTCYINCDTDCRNSCYDGCISSCFNGCADTSRYEPYPQGRSTPGNLGHQAAGS